LRLRARELKIVSPLDTCVGFLEKSISPHMAAEASPERRGKRIGAVTAVLLRQIAPDSNCIDSKVAAKPESPKFEGFVESIAIVR
jgi:hypothetical protein